MTKKVAMNRGYNFGAGPAMLPEDILREVQSELLNWQGLGMSVLETGHRTTEFMQLMKDAEQLLRRLLTIPDNYHVLFLGGPARLQFGMIPLNFITEKQQAGYLITGIWSSLAYEEACRLKKAYCIATSEKNNFRALPPSSEWTFKENTAYLYYTPNETINGVRCAFAPERCSAIPLIADMTSCLLTEPINVADYAMIFAGAQKNIANAGLTLVIIRDDLLNTINDNAITSFLDYRTHVTHKSLYSTPPTFNCYMALKMFQWIEKQGGVESLYKVNIEKAARLYQFIDASSFYQCKIAKDSRSFVNVCFTLVNPELEELFLEKAHHNALLALRGHKVVGGLRASLYNAMPIEGVEKLITFMDDFARVYNA
jgi:phosphoserine aminotransferase